MEIIICEQQVSHWIRFTMKVKKLLFIDRLSVVGKLPDHDLQIKPYIYEKSWAMLGEGPHFQAEKLRGSVPLPTIERISHPWVMLYKVFLSPPIHRFRMTGLLLQDKKLLWLSATSSGCRSSEREAFTFNRRKHMPTGGKPINWWIFINSVLLKL